MDIDHTNRGFAIVRFVDLDGAACSLQESSLASEAAVWFGVSKTATGEDGARIHATHRMALDVARAMEAYVQGGEPKALAFIDLYGSSCAVRMEDGVLLVGVVESHDPSCGDRLMRLDRATASALAPMLASFLRSGGLEDGEGPDLPEDEDEAEMSARVEGADLGFTGIADSDVSVQALLDDFVDMVGDLGEATLREMLGHDRAKALVSRRLDLAPLRSGA